MQFQAIAILSLWTLVSSFPVPSFRTTTQVVRPSVAHVRQSIRSRTAQHAKSKKRSDVLVNGNGSDLNELEVELEAVSPVDTEEEEAVEEDVLKEGVLREQEELDCEYMLEAIAQVQCDDAKYSNDRSNRIHYHPFPKPVAGAVLVQNSNQAIIAQASNDCNMECVQKCLINAGVTVAPLKEWAVSFPSREIKDSMAGCTLYLTMEPSAQRKGSLLPPITRLIEEAGIGRVVIGSMDPVPEFKSKGCAALHAAGVEVVVLPNSGFAAAVSERCESLNVEYAAIANNKLSRRGREHFRRTGRPLGLLHCSVIDSNDAKAFERSGNAFAKDLGGAVPLSERNYGCYEIAPPPEQIWAGGNGDIDRSIDSDNFDLVEEYKRMLDFDVDEDDEGDENFDDNSLYGGLKMNPMMPWYEQVDAVIATFPKPGNGPANDDSIMSRLTGLKWLATNGNSLPAAVERILVLDAADLAMLPTKNDDPNLPPGVDVESFWTSKNRKPPRVLLRHGTNAAAANAARAAAAAAAVASEAARRAMALAESGEAENAAEEAIRSQKAAEDALLDVQRQVDEIQSLRQQLIDMGVIVETIKGGEPIDVMEHLGQRSGYTAVVWRAGCWGSRGVSSILNGAFQWVSAHLAVDAIGGKFWQLMLAERCIQAACGPESKVKVMTEEDDISIEYCDKLDQDCVLRVDGRAIRHVRIDCRVAVVDPNKKRNLIGWKNTAPMDLKFKEEEAPWFL